MKHGDTNWQREMQKDIKTVEALRSQSPSSLEKDTISDAGVSTPDFDNQFDPDRYLVKTPLTMSESVKGLS